MAQLNLSLLLLLLSTFSITETVEPNQADHARSQAMAFIVEQCRATLYPKLCVQCLSDHQNASAQSPQDLAQAALKMSLARAWYTRAYVTRVAAQFMQMKAKEYQVVKDCLDQINDGVDQLSESIKELQHINQDGDGNFTWHSSNVQTWVSTALTDATTCIDGFPSHAVGGKVRATIKARVLNVAQMTSNALALFNRFVARHRATTAVKANP